MARSACKIDILQETVFDVAASPALKQSINHMRFWFHVIVRTDQARANPKGRTNEQARPRQRPAPGPGSSPTLQGHPANTSWTTAE
jgi:hypothetical protein